MKSELIYSRDRAAQLLAFDGMQYGRCRPTDIDMSIDFNGDLFVFCELKVGAKGLTTGQRIHLEGLVNAIIAGGKQAVAILAHHQDWATDTDVHVAEAVVHSMYDGEQWVEEGEIKVDTMIHLLYTHYLTGQQEKR